MKYLVRVKRQPHTDIRIAHIWDDEAKDTLCKMAVSKGLKIINYMLQDNTDYSDKVCVKCMRNKKA